MQDAENEQPVCQDSYAKEFMDERGLKIFSSFNAEKKSQYRQCRQNNPAKDFLRTIPSDLPVPVDDGGCNHLQGVTLPSVNLPSTSGGTVNPSQIPGWLVIYCYPMTGQPGRAIPDGRVQMPGAAGCTPQSCSFRDYYRELQALNTKVFGLSTQSSED